MASLYFIHTPAQNALVEKLKARLQSERGFSILNDSAKSPDECIAAADWVVFVRTPQALDDTSLRHLLEKAFADNKNIAHMNWDSSPATHDVAGLNSIQWVDFAKYRVSGLENDFLDAFGMLRDALVKDDPPHAAFISYTSPIRPLIYQIVRALEARGLNIWLDQDDIPASSLWLDALKRGIEDSHHLVCFIDQRWLASWACNTEFLHAAALNKRIIPVYLTPLPPVEDVLKDARVTGNWSINETDEAIERCIRAVFDRLPDADIQARALHAEGLHTGLMGWMVAAQQAAVANGFNLDDKRYIAALPAPLPETEQLVTQIVTAITPADVDDKAYLEGHTTWYMMARVWNSAPDDQRAEQLPRDRNLDAAINWLRQGETQSPQPTDLHRRYIRTGGAIRQRRRLTLAGVLAGIILVAAFALFMQNAQATSIRQQDQISAQATLQAETDTRLQTIAQLNRRRLLPMISNIRAERPLITADAVWVSDQLNGLLLRFSPADGALVGEGIAVGREPNPPAWDGEFVWVSVFGGSTITRVDPSGVLPPLTVRVGPSPRTPVFTVDAVWLIAGPRATLYRIDRNSGNVTSYDPRDPNAGDPVSDGRHIWITLPGDNAIMRAGERIEDRLDVSLSERPLGVTLHNGDVYVSFAQHIERRDSQTGALLAEFRGGALSMVAIAVEGLIWVPASSPPAVFALDPDTLTIQAEYKLGDVEGVRHLHISPSRVFALGGDALITFDRARHQQIGRASLIGADNISGMISDGEALWLTATQQGRVSVVRQDDGSVFREFTPCQQPVMPVFDGTNMWFACRGEPRIVTMPAATVFFQTESFRVDDHTQQPIVRGDDIWIVQEDAGQVRLLTNGRERGRLRLGAGLLPLIDAGAHLYTAYQEDEDDMGVVVQIDPDARTERRVRVSGDVYSIIPIAGNIWVSHGRPADIGRQDAGNLTIFSESTLLEVRSPARVGIFAGKPVHVDNAVWVTGGSITRGTAFAFDAATAQPIGEPITFPDTPFGAWSPLAIDDSLWFTASAPNLGGIFPILANETTPVQVYALDPVTRTWREDSAFTLPDLVGAPQWDGHYLWYGLQGFGVVTPRQHLINSSGVLAFDLAARTIAGRWSPCQSLTDFSLIGHWVIAGCLNASDDLLLLIDRRDVMLTARTISDVGVNPNPPLLHEGMIWVTFKDTDSAVVLDAETGAVRARYSVGRSPQTPVVYRGAVWVVNSGDGTMQRLSVPESAH